LLPNRFGAFVYYAFEIAVNASNSVFLHARHNVRIKIHRDPDLGVFHALAMSTVPHYGGRRRWFICPIKKIRVAKLHLSPGATQLASRKAHSLTYRSSQTGWRRERSQKFWRRMAQRLGADPDRRSASGDGV
jgi:hypothetical protein